MTESHSRFARRAVAVAVAAVAVLYAFVVLVDPWDTLPHSPPAPRVPISSNARYSFPALARSARFDSIVLGTSTARLLQPAQLNGPFGARFANLAMNSATAWEQVQMLHVFLRAHPAPRAVLIGMDASWCGGDAPEVTARPFPRWMYAPSLWPAYLEMLTPYAVQEAANQFAVLVGWKRPRYGTDGYTSFVPDDAAYDVARVDAAFARWPAIDTTAAVPGAGFAFPALTRLDETLAAIPPGVRVALFFVPTHISQHGPGGSSDAARWAACKAAVVARGAPVLDFMWASSITTDRANYWDPLHYRVAVAARVAAQLAAGGGADVRVLNP